MNGRGPVSRHLQLPAGRGLKHAHALEKELSMLTGGVSYCRFSFHGGVKHVSTTSPIRWSHVAYPRPRVSETSTMTRLWVGLPARGRWSSRESALERRPAGGPRSRRQSAARDGTSRRAAAAAPLPRGMASSRTMRSTVLQRRDARTRRSPKEQHDLRERYKRHVRHNMHDYKKVCSAGWRAHHSCPESCCAP